jgi:hypothetical protein
VLRDPGDGLPPQEVAAMELPADRTPAEVFGMVRALAEFVGPTTPPKKSMPKVMAEVAEAAVAATQPDVMKKLAAASKGKDGKSKGARGGARKKATWLDSNWLIAFIDTHDPMTSGELAAKVCAELGRTYSDSTHSGDGKVILSRLNNLRSSGYVDRDDNMNWVITDHGREGVLTPAEYARRANAARQAKAANTEQESLDRWMGNSTGIPVE